MAHGHEVITLLDVSQKPFRPVTIVLEDGGLETIEWLVEKAQDVLSKVGRSEQLPIKVRVTKLFVGDMEINRANWRKRNIDRYRILDDLWCIQIATPDEILYLSVDL